MEHYKIDTLGILIAIVELISLFALYRNCGLLFWNLEFRLYYLKLILVET